MMKQPWCNGEPNATAINFFGELTTYKSLSAAVLHLTNRILEAIDLESNPVIGIAICDPVERIKGILAALDSGATVVPIDPSWPKQRIKCVAKEASLTLLIHDEAEAEETFTDLVKCQSFRVNTNTGIADYNSHSSTAEWNSIILFTSGSTGTPKGISLSGRMLLNEGQKIKSLFEITSEDRVSHLLSPTMISGLREIISSLISGATLVVIPAQCVPTTELLNHIAQSGVTVCRLVSTLFRNCASGQLHSQSASPRILYIGGERLLGSDVSLFRQTFHRNTQLFNVFGATEYGLCSYYKIKDSDEFQPDQTVPIGIPFEGYKLELVSTPNTISDSEDNGELVVCSEFVANGYVGEQNVNQSKFVIRDEAKDLRCFLTGDRAIRDESGNFEFLGRMDTQVKLRGIRIELQEVENRLLRSPTVSQCSVTLMGDSDHAYLAAFVVASDYLSDLSLANAADLRRFALQELPHAMVPTKIWFVRQLPTLPNGKTDRSALKDLVPSGGEDTFVDLSTATELEKKLHEAWSLALALEHVNLDNDFFELGGDSLTATILLAKVREITGIDASFQFLTKHSTIRSFAAHLATSKNAAGASSSSCHYYYDESKEAPSVVCVSLNIPRLLRTLPSHFNVCKCKVPGTDFYPCAKDFEIAKVAKACAEDWATRNVDHAPAILGFSYGGVVAFSIGVQLQEMGHSPTLILLEPGTPQRHKTLGFFPRARNILLRSMRRYSARDSNKLMLSESIWKELRTAERWLNYRQTYKDAVSKHSFEVFDGELHIVARPAYASQIRGFWEKRASRGVIWHEIENASRHGDMLEEESMKICRNLILNGSSEPDPST